MRPTRDEIIRAIRYYQGDVEGGDPFWGDPKAYVTLNALFFPGLDNERARAGEGKRLNPAVVAEPERLRRLLTALAAGFQPLKAGCELTVYRVERYSEYALQKALGRTVSFTSTSQRGFLGAYRDKRGLALIRYVLPPGTPCLIMRDALPRYLKADEAEALLPPGLGLTICEQPVTGDLARVTDMDGRPPKALAEARAAGFVAPDGPMDAPDDRTGAAAGVRTLSALAEGQEPDPGDAAAYMAWKAALARDAVEACLRGASMS